MHAADTNVLVRLLTGDDVRQTVAAEAFVARGVWVSSIVLIETLWVLETIYKKSATQLMAAVEMLLGNKQMTLQEPELVRDALQLYRQKPSLGFTDCFILHTAIRAGHVPLGTFDRRLGKVQGAQNLQPSRIT